MNLELARLALRRSLPLGSIIAVGAVLALAARIDWAPPGEWSTGGTTNAASFAREGIWTSGLLVLAPLFVHACAATIGHWREGDVDWLGKAPLSRGSILFSTWIGHAIAAAIAACAVALAAEIGARDFAPTHVVVGRAPASHGAIVEEGSTLRWSVAEPPRLRHGARVRVGITLVAGAPTADVRLSLTRHASDGSVQRATAVRHIASTSAIDVEVPRGEGAIEFELAREGSGAIVMLDGSGVAWLEPRNNAAWISVELALRAWIALSALCALALGLGAWVSSGIATALVATLALANWLSDVPALNAWSPWGEVPSALDLAGRGLGLTAHATTILGAIACAGLGLALARWQVTQWRRDA